MEQSNQDKDDKLLIDLDLIRFFFIQPSIFCRITSKLLFHIQTSYILQKSQFNIIQFILKNPMKPLQLLSLPSQTLISRTKTPLHHQGLKSYRHTTDNLSTNNSLPTNLSEPSPMVLLNEAKQIITKIRSRFMALIQVSYSSVQELIFEKGKIGIYDEAFQIDKELSNMTGIERIGSGMQCQGVSELAALRFETILSSYKETEKLIHIIFKCKQRFCIQFFAIDQIQTFLYLWEDEILKSMESCLLPYIHKFTMKLSVINGKIWITLNEPVYDIFKCYNWSSLNKNTTDSKDQELIAYYLRRFFVFDFIKLILYYRSKEIPKIQGKTKQLTKFNEIKQNVNYVKQNSNIVQLHGMKRSGSSSCLIQDNNRTQKAGQQKQQLNSYFEF